MSNPTSHHILNTAANLLGFCLIVITSLHISNKTASTLIDEFTSIIATVLITACVLSFISMRSPQPERSRKLEKMAEYFFISSLLGILLVILFMTSALFHNS